MQFLYITIINNEHFRNQISKFRNLDFQSCILYNFKRKCFHKIFVWVFAVFALLISVLMQIYWMLKKFVKYFFSILHIFWFNKQLVLYHRIIVMVFVGTWAIMTATSYKFKYARRLRRSWGLRKAVHKAITIHHGWMSRIFTKFQNAFTMLVDCSHLLPIDTGLYTNFPNTCRNPERPKAGLRLIRHSGVIIIMKMATYLQYPRAVNFLNLMQKT